MSRLATLSDPCAADLQEARTKLGQAVKTRRGFHNGRIRPGAIGRVV
jgi:hypothetical protein